MKVCFLYMATCCKNIIHKLLCELDSFCKKKQRYAPVMFLSGGNVLLIIYGELGEHRKWFQWLHSQAPWRSIHFSSGCNSSSSQPIAILVVYHSDDLTSLLVSCLMIWSLSMDSSLLSSPTVLSCLCSGLSSSASRYQLWFFSFYKTHSQTPWERRSDWVHERTHWFMK